MSDITQLITDAAFEWPVRKRTLRIHWYDLNGNDAAVMLSRLDTLAHNLAIAGALCESWQLGREHEASVTSFYETGDYIDDEPPWSPGLNLSQAGAGE